MADFMGARQGGFSGQDDDNNQIINGTPSAFLPSASHSSSPSHGIYPQYQYQYQYQYQSHHHRRRGSQEFSWGWAATQQGGAAGHGYRRHREDQNEDGNPDRVESGGESGGGGVVVVQRREHMFDKVVTPSDVGKLNRLVIPKQHAERYFPLDSTANEKGLLLNFEDRGGKPWRFRYSYWNSSQSYVMTKGWSRFVKEKRLDAGDIVSFHRGVDEASKDRLYIDWRRRPDASGPSTIPHHPHNNFTPFGRSFSSSYASGTTASYFPPPPIWNYANPFLVAAPATPARVWDHTARTGHSYYASCSAGGGSSGWYGYDDSLARAWSGGSGPPVYQVTNYMRSGETLRPQAHAQAQAQELGGEEFKSLLPLVQGTPSTGGTAAAGKRLRLFGVNMDCAMSSSSQSSDQDEECDPASPSISNTTTAVHANGGHHHHYHHHLSPFPSMSTSRITAGTMEMDSPPLHIPLHLSLHDDATPVLLNKSKAPASSSTLDFDV